MQDKITLMGERCSGTNLVLQSLRYHTDCEIVWPVGFKHFPPKSIGDNERRVLQNVPVVMMVREPVEWLRSFYARPWHLSEEVRNQSFADFIRNPCWSVYSEESNVPQDDPRYGQIMDDDLDPLTGEKFVNPMDLRTSKLARFRQIIKSAPKSCVIRLEDFVDDQVGVLERVVTDLDLNLIRRPTCRRGYKGTESLRRRMIRSLGLSALFRGPETAREKPILEFSDVQFIWSQLHVELEKSLGYQGSPEEVYAK